MPPVVDCGLEDVIPDMDLVKGFLPLELIWDFGCSFAGPVDTKLEFAKLELSTVKLLLPP